MDHNVINDDTISISVTQQPLDANADADGERDQPSEGGGDEENCKQNCSVGCNDVNVNDLLAKINEMQLEKRELENDFGRKRAKFKELFIQKEEQLQSQKDLYEKEKKDLQTKCHELNKELDELRSLLTVAECEKENLIEVERRKCREEVASMKHLMQEKLDSMKRNYDVEMGKMKKELEKLECELVELKSSENDNLLSVVTKSFKQKVGSLNSSTANNSNLNSFDDNSLIKQRVEVSQHDDEFDMMVPFEEELKVLKEKLRMTDTKLQIYELSLAQLMKHFGTDPVCNVIKSKVNNSDIDLLVKQHSTSTTDEYDSLILYLAMLTTERTALLLQIDKLKSDQVDASTKISKAFKPSPLQSPKLNRSLLSNSNSTSIPVPILLPQQSPLLGSTPNICHRSKQKKLQRSQSLTFTDIEVKGNDKKELKQLNDELKKIKEKLKMPCEMCRNYELQLQKLQNNEVELLRQLAHGQELLKQFKDDLKKEQNFRLEMEEKFNEESKRADGVIQNLCKRLSDEDQLINDIKVQYMNLSKEANDRITALISQHDELSKEMDRLLRENDILLGKFIAKSQVLQNETIDLPQDIDEMQFYCLKLREELITTIVTKESREESLKSELLFLKEQLKGEQQTKETIEENLTQENDSLRVSVDLLQSELNDIKVKFDMQEQQLIEYKDKLDKLKEESQSQITDLQAQVNDLASSKSKLESETSTLRNKVQSLQVELDNSEDVQRDFVKLSQSLQIQLEKIRQADGEVRWQHEDDVTECNSCKKTFHSRKEKSHCSHCGRVFCAECNSKTIHSGPKNRAYKVCSVCHTLLDNQTACWFANEAPQSPT